MILHLYCACEYVHMRINITDIHYRLFNRNRHEQTEVDRKLTNGASSSRYVVHTIPLSGLHMQLGVDFMEGEKPENPEKNPRSTGKINYDNSIHISPKFESQHGAVPRCSPIQLLTRSDQA